MDWEKLSTSLLKKTVIATVTIFFVSSYTAPSPALALAEANFNQKQAIQQKSNPGCCEKLATGKDSCTDPSCISACFTMPTVEACKGLDHSYYWNSGKCWGLSECVGKAATGCCVGADKCYAGFSSSQCSSIGSGFTYTEKGCNAEDNRAKCGGKMEDPNLEAPSGEVAGPGGNSTQEMKPPKFVIPSLAVPLPGLQQFQEPGGSAETVYIIPYIGQYISAVYAWASGLVSILAITMIVWGGVKWLTAGGDSSKVTGAKTTITNAVIGLLLAFGTYLILWTLNPDIVNFKALEISVVQREYEGAAVASSRGTNAAKVNEKEIYEGAVMAGADPCAVLAFCEHESGLKFTWAGIASGISKEEAIGWGPCSMMHYNIKDGSLIDQALRAAFPTIWPPLGTDLSGKGLKPGERMKAKMDVALSNARVSGFYAKFAIPKPTLLSVAGAGIGDGNIKRWRKANCGDNPPKDITLAEAAAMGTIAALNALCLPVYPAGGNNGCPPDQNCHPLDVVKYSSTDGYEVNKKGEIWGQCMNGGRCFTIQTHELVGYTMKSYMRFDAKYHCSAKASKKK